MNTFYDIDSTKVSHREYLWWHKSPLVIIPLMTKWMRVRVPCSSDDPNTESTLPFVVDSLPPEIVAGFEPLAGELAGLGFLDPVYHVISDPGTRATIYWSTFRHESGNYFARIHQRFWQQAQKHDRGRFLMFFTAFTDGTFLVSSSGKPDMAAPKAVQMNRRFGAPCTRLWANHQQLTARLAERRMIAPVRTREDLVAVTERHHVLMRDFHLARGVFRPRTAEQQASAAAFAAGVEQAKAEGLEHAEVLVELQKLQEPKANWAGAGWLLVISLIVFVLLGIARWNWKFTLLIIPVLLFHEAGHWAAMRLFHYRNLRMFFIPLFGAAVSGRNWNVAGWKKAIVSLAGPLPGIGLGIVLGSAGLISKNTALIEAAMLLVFINGFNLLPVLPMDGGWLLHTILFCRNRWLDVIFRILAVVGLMALGLSGVSRIFIYLAILMAVGLPTAFKLSRVTDNLRRTPLPEPLPGEDRIPVPTAQAIITEVKAAFPQGVGNKLIAQRALGVFETLNAKPPGILATIGLLAVHGGTFLLALVFSILLVIGKTEGLGDFARAAIHQPRHSFTPGTVQRWVGGGVSTNLASSHNLVVATFKRHDLAAAEFTLLADQLPATSRLVLFGDSLLLTLPAGDDHERERWFNKLQAATTNVFVAVSNQPVAVNLVCVTPTTTAASNLCSELDSYFELGGEMHLIPPWAPAASQPEFDAFRRARQEWAAVQNEMVVSPDDPALKDAARKMMAATRRGDFAEASRLEAGQQQTIQKLQAEIRDRQAASAATPLRKDLVQWNWELMQLSYTNEAERRILFRKIAASLGEVPYHGGQPDADADALGANSGLTSQHGLMIQLTWVSFIDPASGLPALADWLARQHCIGFKYDINGVDDSE